MAETEVTPTRAALRRLGFVGTQSVARDASWAWGEWADGKYPVSVYWSPISPLGRAVRRPWWQVWVLGELVYSSPEPPGEKILEEFCNAALDTLTTPD